MIDTPIRKKAKNYPKDFTPPPGYLTSASQPIAVTAEPEASPRPHIRMCFNRSTQLTEKPAEEVKNTSSLNPEEAGRPISNQQKELPLVNLHTGRRKPYINPELLARPRIEDKQDQDLIDKQQCDPLEESTPGSIRKNVSLQKPLQEEHPTNIIIPSKLPSSAAISELNQNVANRSFKSQRSALDNLRPKFPVFLRSDSSQHQGSSKLQKRQSSFHVTSSHLRSQKQKEGESQILYGVHQQKQIDKLKAHVNKIIYARNKSKQRIGKTHQTQADFEEATRNSKAMTALHSGDHFRQSRMAGSLNQDTEEENRFHSQSRQKRSYGELGLRPSLASKCQASIRKLKISYKRTSLSHLRQIFASVSQSQRIEIEVSIPDILMSMNLRKDLDKNELYSQSALIFQSLGLPADTLNVKRYSNCVMMLSKNICIIWHYDGRIYLGSWQTKYLDEGFKHGLGLEWVPNHYVYYGEFLEGKKAGLGVMKTTDQLFIGEWSRGKRTQNGYFISKSGQVSTNCSARQFQSKPNQETRQQYDPFA